MDPASTFAIVVGVETYAAGEKWSLDGPASDALRFANWLIKRKVPAENIRAFVSALSPVTFPDGVEVRVATRQNIDEVIRTTLADRREELLIFFWGGHGAIGKDSTHRFFYSDATARDKKNLDFNDLRRALRSSYYNQGSGLRKQILIVDACATFAAKMPWPFELPADQFPKGVPTEGREQFVLFGTRPGKVAQNIGSEKTGIFSRELLKRLAATDSWPPDFKDIAERLIEDFKKLRSQKQFDQIPGYSWFSDGDGFERELGRPTDASGRDRTFELSKGLLPYLVDRKDQNTILEKVIQGHREQRSKIPLICFLHGEPEQCLLGYQWCLEAEYLWRLLRMPQQIEIPFKRVEWPAAVNRIRRDSMGAAVRQEFLLDLATKTRDGIFISGEEAGPSTQGIPTKQEITDLQRKISQRVNANSEPLAIFFHLSASDFYDHPSEVRWFVDFWLAISVNPQNLCLVFVFVEHGGSRLSPFAFFQKLLPLPSRKFQSETPDLKKPDSLTPAHVLPELDSVAKVHLTEWINRYSPQIEQYWSPACSLCDELIDHFGRNGSKLPMFEFVKVIKDLLQISHTPTSS